MPKLQDIVLRFWSFVNKTETCWLWTGQKVNHNGLRYGTLFTKGKRLKATHLAYYLFHGDIPNGMNILHSCDNSMCVRPEHLRAGTQLDNVDDMKKRGRAANQHVRKLLVDGKIMCNGIHEYIPVLSGTHKGCCRICTRAANLRSQAKNREKRNAYKNEWRMNRKFGT